MNLFSMGKQKQPQIKATTEVYEECSGSVAKIDTLRRGPLGDHPGDGSAFVWDTDRRLLVTCYHVIHEAFDISAIFHDGAGTPYQAKVVFSDPNRDLAVLCVDVPKDKLRPITAGESDTVNVGDEVLVIGSPFGRKNYLTRGIVSQLGGEVNVPERYNDNDGYTYPAYRIQGAVETDAAINPGNSGGPVIDKSSGKVIGMVSCIIPSKFGTSTGVASAIPINTISEFVIEALLKSEKDKRINLGIGKPLYNSSQCHMNNPDSMNSVCTMVSGRADMMDTRPNLRIDSPHLSVEQSGDITNSANEMCCDAKMEHQGQFRDGEIFRYLLQKVAGRQDVLQKRFLEAMEKREHDRLVREEAWRMQEMARINREGEILAQETAIAAAKDAAVTAFLRKIAEQQNPGQALNNINIPISQPQPQPPPPPPPGIEQHRLFFV